MGDGRQFKIEITGDAQGLVEASQEGASALEKQAVPTIKLLELTDKQKAAIQANTAATGAGAAAHGEAGKAAEKHAGHVEGLHRVFHKLNELMPGLGSLMQAAFSPMGALMSAIGIGIGFMVQRLEAYREKIAETRKVQAEVNTAVWEAQSERLNEAKQSAEEYKTAIENLIRSMDTLKTKEEAEVATLHAILAARKKILEAQMQSELAAVKGDPVAEAAVRQRFGKYASREEITAEEAALTQKQRFEAEQRAQEAKDKAAADAAQSAKERGPGAGMADAAKAAEARAETLKKELEKAQLAADEAGDPTKLRAAANAFGDKPSFEASGSDAPPQMSEAGRARMNAAAAEEAAKKLEAARNNSEEGKAAIAAYAAAVKKLDEEQKFTFEQWKKRRDQVNALTAEIGKDRQVLEINRTAANQAADLATGDELAAAGFKRGSKLGRTLIGDIETEEGLSHGEKMTEEQTKAINQLMGALKAAGNSQQRINELLADMMNLHIGHEQKLKELATALKQVKAQTASSVNP